MTLYVDDITISGERASKRLLWSVNEIIRHHGLKVKNKKSISFAPACPKPVTGVIITGDKLRIPNKLHKTIWEERYKLSKTKDQYLRSKLEASNRGKIQVARQIDPSFK